MRVRSRVIAFAVGSLMFALTGAALGSTAAVAAQTGTGRLEFVHAAQGAPNLGINLFEPRGGIIGKWVATPGSTTTPVPDDPLAPGTYSMRIDPPGGGSTSGLPAIASFDVPITAGVTTIVTARGDSLDSLEFTISTESGVGDRDEQVPLPTRIDTGAGGTALTDRQAPLVPSVVLAVTALLAAFTDARLRRSDRADGRAARQGDSIRRS